MTHVTLSLKTLNLVLGYLKRQVWEEANPIIVAVHAEVIPQLSQPNSEEPDQAIGGSD